MEAFYATVAAQLTVVGMLFRWLQVQTRDNRVGLTKVVRESYTKEETKEAIALRNAPLEQGISHMREDLKEVKLMLNKLLDEKK